MSHEHEWFAFDDPLAADYRGTPLASCGVCGKERPTNEVLEEQAQHNARLQRERDEARDTAEYQYAQLASAVARIAELGEENGRLFRERTEAQEQARANFDSYRDEVAAAEAQLAEMRAELEEAYALFSPDTRELHQPPDLQDPPLSEADKWSWKVRAALASTPDRETV